MPITTKSKVFLAGPLTGGGPAYFHPEDVSIVMSQPGAVAVTVVDAIINNTQCRVMVAVQEFDENGVILKVLDDADHLVAVGCPPFNKAGGVFLSDPQPQE